MKKIKKFMTSSLIVMLSLSVMACSNTDQNATSKPTAAGSSDGPIKVRFWHAFGGVNQEAINNLTADYNASQEKYVVVPQFQGTYDDMLIKFRATFASKDAPALVMNNDVSTKAMINTKKIVPAYEYIDKEKHDLSKMVKSIANYYSIDGKLYSLPLAASVPLLYYNKDLFKKAGLDPENPPKTYEQVLDAAKKLTIKEGGKTIQYGFTTKIEAWFFEQLLAAQGGNLIDQENGRKGDPTKTFINGKEAQNILGFYDQIVKDGSFGNFADNWDQIKGAFQSQKVAMYFDSTGALRQIADQTKDKFNFGVAYMPHPTSTEWQGVIPGGGSLWITNLVDEKERDGAWDFMKFVTTADSQAKLHVKTGYLPNNVDSYKDKAVTDLHEKYPQFKIGFNELQDTKASSATQGALTPAMPEIRKAVNKAIGLTLTQEKDYKAALQEAETEANRGIDLINRANKQ